MQLGTAAGYSEFDPLVDFDQIISERTEKPMGELIELEPLPDAKQAPKRGRPKKNADAAKEREADVQKVKDILH